MSSREFAEWMAFAQVEPIGEDREDYRLAYLMSFLTNMVVGLSHSKEKKRVFELHEFLPNFWEEREKELEQPEEPPRQSIEQMLQNIELWKVVWAGKEIRQ